jgi:hypothetical protein
MNMADEIEAQDKETKKGVYVSEQFGIIALVVVASLVALIFSLVNSAFPGLKPSISKMFSELRQQTDASESRQK